MNSQEFFICLGIKFLIFINCSPPKKLNVNLGRRKIQFFSSPLFLQFKATCIDLRISEFLWIPELQKCRENARNCRIARILSCRHAHALPQDKLQNCFHVFNGHCLLDSFFMFQHNVIPQSCCFKQLIFSLGTLCRTSMSVDFLDKNCKTQSQPNF